MPGEFALIRRHFTVATTHTDLGVGDDCALMRVAPGMQLAVSTDMLVAGTHFFADTDPEDLGWKTLAVSVSDLAAMGATPRWVVLAASLPQADDGWIAAFSRGFQACCAAHGIDSVGGDTTRGPLNLCATLFGEVPAGQAILRSGGRAGDRLWLSGRPGRAALGLRHLQGRLALTGTARTDCLAALTRPQPRLALGLALRGLAHAMLDVSDGVLGDLGHLLTASGVGATLDESALPLAALAALAAPTANARQLAADAFFHGGDDYELLFCAAPDCDAAIDALSIRLGVPLTAIGELTDRPGSLFLRSAEGRLQPLAARGYDHFAADAAPAGRP